MATQTQLDQAGSSAQLEALYNYGGNPLFHAHSVSDGTQRLAAFGGAFQPGLYKPTKTKFANPVPMGLSGFALTTFLLSCVNLGVKGLSNSALVVGPAYAYGGLIQILAGMWEMAIGNVFGATALTSYGSFWISIGIINTPGLFEIAETYGGETPDFFNAFGLYLYGWFIFTFILWLCTLRSTVAFCSLFLTVWLTFLCLATGYVNAQNQADKMPDVPLIRAGGAFGIVAGFLAWYNALAGIAEPSNSFFVIPVAHFPWSAKARADRQAVEKEESGHMA